MKARELMTGAPSCCTPDDTARDATRAMRERDCGLIPIVESKNSRRVVGVVSDRDIALRAVAEGKSPDTPLRELMTSAPSCCGLDDDIKDIERTMADRQVRRVVIVDDGGECAGIIAQADIARAAKRGRSQDITEQEVGLLVEVISQPARGEPFR
jgi:CBS domain-containing protein